MTHSNTESNLQFGQFAVRFGNVSEQQLQAAIAAWNGEADRSLGDVLVEQGALTEKGRKSLETLMAAYLLCDPEPSGARVEDAPAEIFDSSQADTLVQSLGDTVVENDGESLVINEGYRFKRTELHAEGGLGKVYEAHDRQLNRTVALKEIKERYADDSESRERFTKEAEITGRLEHPGIVPVYALGRYVDGRPYYAMRFIKGHSLRTAIGKYHASDSMDRADRVLGMREMLGRLIDVCDAISYAHRRGIVHRDIKPSNIMLGDYGETLVVDWGLAKNLGRREINPSASVMPTEDTLMPASGSSVTETMAGKAIGSPAFMSPEQARGEHDTVAFASDIYGLGATLYMILTGRPPVQGSTSMEVLTNVRKGAVTPPRAIDRSIARPLEAICLKALAHEAGDRYRSVRDLRRDLDHYLADERVAAHRETMLEAGLRLTRRRKWMLPTILVGLFGLVAVAGVVTWSEQARRAEAAANAEARQAEAVANAKAKEEAVQAAFDTVSRAYRVIDPFADNDTNVAALEDECERISASDIPDLAKAKVYDALVYQFKKFKRPEVATKWAKRALEISRSMLGQDDPETRQRAREVIQTYEYDARYSEAAEWLESLLAKETTKGDEYYALAHDLSAYYVQLNEFDRAIEMLREVVAYREGAYGNGDKRTIGSRSLLGTVLSKTGRHAEGRQLLEMAAESASTSQQFTTEQRLALASNAVMSLVREGDYEEALRRYEALFPQYEESLGLDHPSTLSLRYSIARTQRGLQQYDRATENLQKVLADYKRILGADHPKVRTTQLAIAQTRLAGRDFDQAATLAGALLDAYQTTTNAAENKRAHLAAQTLVFALLGQDKAVEAQAAMGQWKALEATTLPEMRFSALLADAEVAQANKNYGIAEQLASAAAECLDHFAAGPADRAGLASLKGAILQANGDLSAAETALLAALEGLQEEVNLQPHQRFWPEQVRLRLVGLYENSGRPDKAERYRNAD